MLTNYGISKLHQGDFVAARELLESSLAIAPDDERTQAALLQLDVAEVEALVSDDTAGSPRGGRPSLPHPLQPHLP